MLIGELQSLISEHLKEAFLPHIRRRGNPIHSQAKVHLQDIDFQRRLISFEVEGGAFYEVYISWKKATTVRFHSQCDCPYEGNCKHAAAAFLFIQDHERILRQIIMDLETSGMGSGRSQKSKSTHPASQPYRIENPESLDLNNLRKHGTPTTRDGLPPLEINMQNENGDYSIAVSFPDQDLFEAPYDILIAYRDAGLEVSCSCNRRVKKLCIHAYGVVYYLLENDKNFFKTDHSGKLEEEARKAVDYYGLPSDRPWQNYLDWSMEDGEYCFKPAEKYAGLFNPSSLQLNAVQRLYSTDPGEELPLPEESSTFYWGLFFEFSANRMSFKMAPLSGAAKGPGERFRNKIAPFDNSGDLSTLQMSPEELQLSGLCGSITSHPFVYKNPEEEDLAEILATLQRYGALLEAQPRVYLYKPQSWQPHNTIRQKDLHHVQFHAQSPELLISFREEEGLIFSQIFIRVDGQYFPLKGAEVEDLHHLFLRCGKYLFMHSSLRDARTFRTFLWEDDFITAVQHFPEALESFWSHLAPFYELDFSEIHSLSFSEKTLQPMQKEIFLSEVGDFIIFKPTALYQEGQRVEVLAPGDTLSQEGENSIVMQRRDRDWEAEFIAFFRSLHPDFAEQRRPDFFYLPAKEFMKDQWFLKVFPSFQQKEIAVYGWKELSTLTVSPYPAKINYKVEHHTDWFESEVNIAFGDTEVSLDQVRRTMTDKGFIRLDDGTQGLVPEQWVEKLQKLLKHGKVKDDKIQVSDKLFTLVDELFEDLDDQEAAAFIAEKKQKLLQFDQIHKHPLPSGVDATLRPYQEDGFHWLCFLHEFQWGGILADDMGLGKSLQVITFLAHVLQENKQTNLVIVPTSLLFNWENELQKFAPGIKAYYHHGKDRSSDLQVFDDCDIVFTSYGIMARDLEKLQDYPFNYLILDESQAIKNPASRRYKAARLLQARNRLALTGTPVENNTFDLYAQLSFLNPGLLGTATSFKENYAKPIDSQRDERKAAELQKMIRPFVLRRTKEQVARDLPDKVEDVLYCEMQPAQRKVYDAFRNHYREMLLDKIDEEGLNQARFSVLEGLTKLRQVCDSPEILGGNEDYGKASVKLDEILQHIREKTGHHKILVFSQFVKMLRLIENRVQEAGISYAYLDGQSSTADRQANVAHFQEEDQCRIFLISLKAGGTGLNLMAADYVYLVDPWWNPAVENQAIDRCYRIGQDKKVIAYRMLCKDTVEEKIVALQQRKKAVAADLVQTDENIFKQLDRSDILDLFSS